MYREILQNQLINAASGNFANDATGGSWQQVAPFAVCLLHPLIRALAA